MWSSHFRESLIITPNSLYSETRLTVTRWALEEAIDSDGLLTEWSNDHLLFSDKPALTCSQQLKPWLSGHKWITTDVHVIQLWPLTQGFNCWLHVRAGTSCHCLGHSRIINKFMHQQLQSQVVDENNGDKWSEPGTLRHASTERGPAGECFIDFDALLVVTQEWHHPTHDEVRNTVRLELLQEDIMIDVIESLRIVDKQHTNWVTFVEWLPGASDVTCPPALGS